MSLRTFLSKVFLITSLLMAAVNHSTALAKNELSPFVGLNIGNYKVFFEPGYGQKMFRKDAVFYNICAGIKINDSIGIEIGHQHDNKRKNLKDANHYPGVAIPLATDVYFKTNLNIKHIYAGISVDYSLSNNFAVGVLMGISAATISASHTIYSLHGERISPSVANKMIALRTYKKCKLVTMVSSRVHYKISEKVSLRISANYFKLSRVPMNSQQNNWPRDLPYKKAPATKIRIKSPINYSIGLIASF